MDVCRLASEADLRWALHRVDQGHTVRLEVDKPFGTRKYRRRRAEYTEWLVQQAREHGAHVVELERDRRAGRCIRKCVLFPAEQRPGGEAGVREPRRPRPPGPSLAAEADYRPS